MTLGKRAIERLINNIAGVVIQGACKIIADHLERALGDNISDEDKLNWIYRIAQDLKKGRLPE